MSVEAFLDTNVLLYAASKDPAERRKAEIAQQLMLEERFGVSIQLLQEFFHNARRKARLRISAEQAEQMLTALLRRPLVLMDVGLFSQARAACERWDIGYWDAAMLVGAQKLGASRFYSEDLNPGQDYGGIKVINPFAE